MNIKWFRRKPRKFNYGAIRIGNVYVLPPDEDDVREFNRRRRRELTRRGFVVAGAAAALGAVAWLVLPGHKRGLDPKRLLEINPARADRGELAELCTAFYQHPDPAIRTRCAVAMSFLPEDATIKRMLWELIEADRNPGVRMVAVRALIHHHDHADIDRIVDLYRSVPASRPVIDQSVATVGFAELRRALDKPRR